MIKKKILEASANVPMRIGEERGIKIKMNQKY